MPTTSYRRARHSVSLLHAHLVFVTKYRRPIFTDAMLSLCQHTMRDGCADLDAELVEFNGEATTCTCSCTTRPPSRSRRWCTGSKGAPPTPYGVSSPATVSARTRGHL
jgi:putative transposase